MNKVEYYIKLYNYEEKLLKKREHRLNRRKFDLVVMKDLIHEVESKYTIDAPKKIAVQGDFEEIWSR